MANKKISALTSATVPLTGTELVPIVKSGATEQVTVGNLTKGRTVEADAIGMGTASPSGVITTKVIDIVGAAGANSQLVLEGDTGTQFVTLLSGTSSSNLPSLYFNNGLRVAIATAKDATGYAEIGRWGTTGFTPAAGKGVNFTANTPAAGMTSQLLNWYEEGTWTPNQGAGLTVIGAFTSNGSYVRIGRLIHVRATLRAATSMTCSSGNAICSNLPFNSAVDTAGVYFNGETSGGGSIDASSTTAYAAGAIAATVGIYFSVVYQT